MNFQFQNFPQSFQEILKCFENKRNGLKGGVFNIHFVPVSSEVMSFEEHI